MGHFRMHPLAGMTFSKLTLRLKSTSETTTQNTFNLTDYVRSDIRFELDPIATMAPPDAIVQIKEMLSKVNDNETLINVQILSSVFNPLLSLVRHLNQSEMMQVSGDLQVRRCINVIEV